MAMNMHELEGGRFPRTWSRKFQHESSQGLRKVHEVRRRELGAHTLDGPVLSHFESRNREYERNRSQAAMTSTASLPLAEDNTGYLQLLEILIPIAKRRIMSFCRFRASGIGTTS